MKRECSDNIQNRLLLVKRTLTLLFIMCATFARGPCSKGGTLIPIAPEPVGSGARALGQSAFIAVTDDATAASWNPAGLINLEKPEASFVGIWRAISNDPSVSGGSNSYIGESWSETEINFMSYARPIVIGNTNLVLSVNYHQVFDLGVVSKSTTFTAKSKGAISACSIAGAMSIPFYPKLTVGASFNEYTRNICNNYIRQVKTIYPSKNITYTETLDNLQGHNFTFGLLWDVYEREEKLLTLGLVYHTPFTADLDLGLERIENGSKSIIIPEERLEIDFPSSIGMGLNYRFCDKFSMAFDIQKTNWSDHKYTGATLSPNDDALAYRLGFEHLTFPEDTIGPIFALRGGVFYEPRPAWNDILDVYGLSTGVGWTLKEQFSLDLAYQFRWGKGDNFTTDATSFFDYDIEEHWFIGSFIIYF